MPPAASVFPLQLTSFVGRLRELERLPAGHRLITLTGVGLSREVDYDGSWTEWGSTVDVPIER